MSSFLNKPFNQSTVADRGKLPSSFNLWGSVKYPRNLVSHITYETQNVYEKSIAITFGAVFLLLFGMLAFFACRLRRRRYQIFTKEARIHFGSRIGSQSATEIQSKGERSLITFSNEETFRNEKAKNEKREIGTSKKLPPKIISTANAKGPKICFENKNDAVKSGKTKPTKFQDWRSTLFERQRDVAASM